MKALVVTSAVFLGAVLAFSTLARASDPPVVSVGPVGGPNDTTPSSASTASNGQTDACVSNQHSGVDPAASTTTGAVQLTDRTCGAPIQGNTAGQAAGAQAGGAPATEARAPAQTSSGGGAVASAGTARSSTVTAASAVGLRIASVRVTKRGMTKTRSFSVVVTVSDRFNRSVRYAFIALGCRHAARGVAGCKQSSFSNARGRATFRLRLGKHVHAHRLSISLTARTPKARAQKLVTVRLAKAAT
jgi:hypothetical protein